MSLCRPAILRIAPVIVGLVLTTFVAGVHAEDRLFDNPDVISAAPGRSPSQQARDELTQARRALLRARISITHTICATEAHLRRGPEYCELQVAALRAITEYNEARRPVFAKLAREFDYARLTLEREALRAEIRRLVGIEGAEITRILPLANEALAVGQRLTRSEVIGLALDTRAETARQIMVEAFAQLRRTGETYRERIAQEPVVIMAREDVAQAKARVAEANQRLAMALRLEADAERRSDRRNERLGG